jgi:photosystem II stability/assembly factor-like uncharacterized protein
MTRYTRRSVLTVTGTSLAGSVLGAAGTAAAQSGGWTVAETPVETTLHDLAHTAANAHAVGGDGVIIERTEAGWRTAHRGGPTGNGNDLYGAATTDDGQRLWLAGASGAIGEYDITTGNLVDRSAPNDQTANFNDVAVTGSADDAYVFVADDSGAIHYSYENGEEGTWESVTPGSGAGLQAIEFNEQCSGHVIDSNGKVFETTDAGATWEPIGVEDADVNFYGLDSDARDDVRVSGGNGSILTYDGSQWETESLGDADLRDVETGLDHGYTVGGGGVVFELVAGEWRRNDTPTGENLKAVATGATDLTVGASGLVLERNA